MPRITVKTAGETTTVDYDDPPPPPPPTPSLPAFHRVGISSSRQGLGAGEDHKRQACIDRYNEMAAQLGISGAAMRMAGGRHVYDQSSALPSSMNSIGVFAHCVADGYGCVMLTSSTWGNHAGLADGSLDAALRAFYLSKPVGVKVIHNIEHEPSNNAEKGNWPSTATEKSQWRQIQARAAAIVYDIGDPDLHYTDCHIPGSADSTDWDWLPELKLLRPNDWQAINARTYLGMDPYPEVGYDNGAHVVQTLAKKVAGPVGWHRNRGRTGPLCLPEVGLFNWCIFHAEPYSLTAAQQAQRLHDQLWTWGQANQLAAYFYYDVADLNDADVRDSTRILDTTPELLEYARLCRGDNY